MDFNLIQARVQKSSKSFQRLRFVTVRDDISQSDQTRARNAGFRGEFPWICYPNPIKTLANDMNSHQDRILRHLVLK